MQPVRNPLATSDRFSRSTAVAGPLSALSRRVARQVALNLFGVSLGGDLHERASDRGLALPLSRARAQRIQRIRQAGVLFVHVPKCAGMAICRALYGVQLKHGTLRWYRQSAPQLTGLPSFAIVREPVDRFISAYRYAIAGGSPDNRVAAAFHDRYRSFRGLDDALDHVEGVTSVYQLDHIFRPQHWYVTDAAGRVGVDQLFCVTDPALPRLVEDHGGRPLTRVNRSNAPRPTVSSRQAARIRRLYRDDCELYAGVSASRDALGETIVLSGPCDPCA